MRLVESIYAVASVYYRAVLSGSCIFHTQEMDILLGI